MKLFCRAALLVNIFMPFVCFGGGDETELREIVISGIQEIPQSSSTESEEIELSFDNNHEIELPEIVISEAKIQQSRLPKIDKSKEDRDACFICKGDISTRSPFRRHILHCGHACCGFCLEPAGLKPGDTCHLCKVKLYEQSSGRRCFELQENLQEIEDNISSIEKKLKNRRRALLTSTGSFLLFSCSYLSALTTSYTSECGDFKTCPIVDSVLFGGAVGGMLIGACSYVYAKKLERKMTPDVYILRDNLKQLGSQFKLMTGQARSRRHISCDENTTHEGYVEDIRHLFNEAIE